MPSPPSPNRLGYLPVPSRPPLSQFTVSKRYIYIGRNLNHGARGAALKARADVPTVRVAAVVVVVVGGCGQMYNGSDR